MPDSTPRAVDAPPRVWSSAGQAASWLGWGLKRFKSIARAESVWLRPDPCGGSTPLYHWLDIVVLAHLYRHGGGRKPPKPVKPRKSSPEKG